jgi:hypothetical protein
VLGQRLLPVKPARTAAARDRTEPGHQDQGAGRRAAEGHQEDDRDPAGKGADHHPAGRHREREGEERGAPDPAGQPELQLGVGRQPLGEAHLGRAAEEDGGERQEEEALAHQVADPQAGPRRGDRRQRHEEEQAGDGRGGRREAEGQGAPADRMAEGQGGGEDRQRGADAVEGMEPVHRLGPPLRLQRAGDRAQDHVQDAPAEAHHGDGDQHGGVGPRGGEEEEPGHDEGVASDREPAGVHPVGERPADEEPADDADKGDRRHAPQLLVRQRPAADPGAQERQADRHEVERDRKRSHCRVTGCDGYPGHASALDDAARPRAGNP